MQSALGAACLTGMYSDNCVTGFSASVVVVVTAGRAAGTPLHARRGPSSHPAQYSTVQPVLDACWLLVDGCCLLAAGWRIGERPLAAKGRWQRICVMKVHDRIQI